MKVKIEIRLENDAFIENQVGEVSRILHSLADSLHKGDTVRTVRDLNGNSVGVVEWSQDLDW